MLTSNVSKAIFHGNGTTTHFPINFKVWNKSQLMLEVANGEGVNQAVSPWSVVLTDTGGTVNYTHNNAPLPEGYSLSVVRNMPFTQEVNLISGTRFDPHVIEEQLDKATAERQQLYELVARAMKVPITATYSPDNLLDEIFTAHVESVQSAQTAKQDAATAEDMYNKAKEEADRAARSGNEPDGISLVSQEHVLSVKTYTSSTLPALPVEQQAMLPASMQHAVPSGGIILWSGNVDAMPYGWALCDGENGTPDLRDKFVLGGDGANQGNSGGSNTTLPHTLSVEEMPSHSHSGGMLPVFYEWGGNVVGTNERGWGRTDWTNPTGGSQAHSHGQNLPPYYVLAYIMKLA